MSEETKNQECAQDQSMDDPVPAEQMVRENIGWMLALAQRMLGDRSTAEDAVQDAFLSAYTKLDAFEGRSSLKTWLHRITVNAALMKLRSQKRLAEQPIDNLLPEFDTHECRIEAPWTYLASVETILANEQLIEIASDKLKQLPEIHRIVLQLRDIEGYSTAEVADLLGISLSNVKVTLHRARSALKRLLEPILRGEKL